MMTTRRRHRSAAAPSAAPASPSAWGSASGLPLLFLLLVAGPGSGESRALRVTNVENMQEQHHFSEGQHRRLKAGYRHLGCFRFDAGDGRMTKKLEAIDMTLEMCDEACNGGGSKSSYFATERGEECWCTADSHFDYSSGGVGLCNRWCGGDGSAMCGGQDARDVFATEIGPAAGPKLMAQAGATASPLDSLLGLHNEARCMHGAEPLIFAEPVAITARAYAETLTSDDNCGSMEAEHSTGLGENVFVCSNPVGDRTECFTPQGAMDYFYESQIDSGLPSTYGPLATQLLWGPTSQLGCAFERCISGGFAYNVLVCHYSPPVSYGTPTGNEVGPVTKTQEECAPQQ